MCGIIGYAGPRPAAPILLESLQRLEYRGYDSAGIAVLEPNGGSTVVKNDHKVAELVRQVEAEGLPEGTVGIGHTRWATHGRPSVENAHPHQDCSGNIHLIHNGIIENYRELRAELIGRGHTFSSDTDTEVVPHLIEDQFRGDLAAAVRGALKRIRGAYALVVMSAEQPDRIVGARLNAPLVVGLGHGESFISSDITALIPYTKRVALLGEGEVVTATASRIDVQTLDGTFIEPRVVTVDWEAEQAQKGGYPHYLLKEIHEQPDAVRNALRDRITDAGMVALPDVGISDTDIANLRECVLVACGSAWYAAMVARQHIERLAGLRCSVEAASEFRYSDVLSDEHSLVIAFSQSGETADTLAAVRHARRNGARVIAVTNVVGSALSLEADGVLYMQAGPEISVAATKTFVNQMLCGILLALHLGDVRGVLAVEEHQRMVEELQRVPELIERVLGLEDDLGRIAQRYAHARTAMYIARGMNFPVALEGALKLKEISYVHAEGYAAGELKHGPIALLDPEVPVVAIATRSRTLPKLVTNVQEVRSRDAPVIALITEGEDPFDSGLVQETIPVPGCDELVSPLVDVVPLQLFAYHMAVQRGCDVDQPRNLAKSVTVE
ncbi:MAG: glutamine--fructose-6-phosphate transaminase (isomerizing) [Candidatus Dormibacteraeota bacterium]|nr:glutamine--fructose-6-phosphate transaminase (isomerizing) [Candidatus Dormibacteraeota bacterium]MBV9524691.1 glutamine--fructose-6-phosphate transaminase (isomerizing) [Candidatus Dormibacteraeota bacterium]